MNANANPSPVRPVLTVMPAIGAAKDDELIILDQKLLAGWSLYAEKWPGRTLYLVPEIDPKELMFGEKCHREELPGDIEFVQSPDDITDAVLKASSIVLAAGDSFDTFALAERARRSGIPLCYVIEYTLGTRLRIEWETPRPILRKLWTSMWLITKERGRRAAFRKAAALQANGVPAAEAYRSVNDNVLLYFDTRLSRSMVATDAQIAAKTSYLREGAPLRLAFTGRLELLKGAHHLIPVARRLLDMGVKFQLDIYGTGSLLAGMERELARDGRIGEVVKIHRPIDFSTELVPWLRTSVDLFLCCHIQGDPSCTYAETLGCGVPIVGYDNEAWKGMLPFGNFGWQVKLGDQDALAAQIAALDGDRAAIASAMTEARDFGHEHCFESVFAARIRHLEHVAGLVPSAPDVGSNKEAVRV
jgi:glycosyltransferase involved in cell wall biosynthesis